MSKSILFRILPLFLALLLSFTACVRVPAPENQTAKTETAFEDPAAAVIAACSEHMKTVTGAKLQATMSLSVEKESVEHTLNGEMTFAPFACHLQMPLDSYSADTLDLYLHDADVGTVLYVASKQTDSRILSAYYERVGIKHSSFGNSMSSLFQYLFSEEISWNMEETETSYILRTEVGLDENVFSLLGGKDPQLIRLSAVSHSVPQTEANQIELDMEIDREQLLLRRVTLDVTKTLSGLAESLETSIDQAAFSVNLSDYNNIDHIAHPICWTDHPINALSIEDGAAHADPNQLDALTIRVGEYEGEIQLSTVSANDMISNGWMPNGMTSRMGQPTKILLTPYTSYKAGQSEAGASSAVILYTDAPGASTFDEKLSAPSTSFFFSSVKDLETGILDENIRFETPEGICSGMKPEQAIGILGEPTGRCDEGIFTSCYWSDGETVLTLYFFPENGLFAVSRGQVRGAGNIPLLRSAF